MKSALPYGKRIEESVFEKSAKALGFFEVSAGFHQASH
jgi:hypothetical protein